MLTQAEPLFADLFVSFLYALYILYAISTELSFAGLYIRPAHDSSALIAYAQEPSFNAHSGVS